MTDNYVPVAVSVMNAEIALVIHVPEANPDVTEHYVQTVMNVSNAEIVNASVVQAENPAVREESVPIAVNARYAVNVSVAKIPIAPVQFVRTVTDAATEIVQKTRHAIVARLTVAVMTNIVKIV